MKKTISLIIALSLAIGLLAACGSSAPAPAAEAEAKSFIDDCGREVFMPADINRIVPTGPLSQMLLFAIAPEMLVGLASRWDSSCEGIIPEEYLSLEYFGQLYGSADLNVESLALAAPQLIIDIGEVKESTADDVEALQSQLGIPCVFIESTLDTMPKTYRKLGKLLGLEDRAEALAAFCENVYSRSLSIMEQVGENRAKTIYIPAFEGLSVLAKGSYHAEVVDLLSENIAVVEEISSRGTGNPVDMEQIALWIPSILSSAPPRAMLLSRPTPHGPLFRP